mmetsp:Transcript_454/g.630  ORF Transcript_454/g.630 Transcript_454/m.630 type:complete len:177 (-) Transcript_454:361-891(-)
MISRTHLLLYTILGALAVVGAFRLDQNLSDLSAYKQRTRRLEAIFAYGDQQQSDEKLIVSINGEEHWNQVLNSCRDLVVVAKFGSPYCPPCVSLGAMMKKWANQTYLGRPVVFLDVNVYDEKNEALQIALGVQSLPTVHIYRGEEKVDDFLCGQKSCGDKYSLFTEKVDAQLAFFD